MSWQNRVIFFHDSFDLNQISSPLTTNTPHHNRPTTMLNCWNSVFLMAFLSYTLSFYYQIIQIWICLSTVHSAILSMSTSYAFLPVTIFSVYSPSITGISWWLCTHWAKSIVESNTHCCQLSILEQFSFYLFYCFIMPTHITPFEPL